jgi:hypothetical protein
VHGELGTAHLSWYHCRDMHKADPRLARPTAVVRHRSHRGAHASVFAQLGGIAAAIVQQDDQCLVTLTDGTGRILASWGSPELRRRAADSNLGPHHTWPEHWCRSMHEWTCIGVAVYDAVTRDPVAALNISSCCTDDITVHAHTLIAQLQPVRAGLHAQALRDGIEISRAFVEADLQARGKLVAIDVAGNVIAANAEARAVLDDLPQGFLLDPAGRWRPGAPQIRTILAQSGEHLHDDPGWVGSADLGTPLLGRSEMFSLTPVQSADGVIGWVLFSGRDTGGGEIAVDATPRPGAASSCRPGRIAAVHDGQVLLLEPSEIRYAEADRHAVWLTTDAGRVRASTQGMDNVDAELTPCGFLRVHRSYLVNLERVRAVGHRGKGILTLSTDPDRDELIPVSRRCAPTLRSLLGL